MTPGRPPPGSWGGSCGTRACHGWLAFNRGASLKVRLVFAVAAAAGIVAVFAAVLRGPVVPGTKAPGADACRGCVDVAAPIAVVNIVAAGKVHEEGATGEGATGGRGGSKRGTRNPPRAIIATPRRTRCPHTLISLPQSPCTCCWVSVLCAAYWGRTRVGTGGRVSSMRTRTRGVPRVTPPSHSAREGLE